MTKSVAIVGSGPAGLYAAEALAKAQENIKIYIIEALFCPYGLLRSGVAPDHIKIKQVEKLFEKILERPNVYFLGNVFVGKDIDPSDLKNYFDAVIICTGASLDKKLNIPGEDLKNIFTATNFVAWYNCHPWFQEQSFNLEKENVAVIGQGNVALDVTRILLKKVSELQTTDISDHAINALSASKVKNLYLIGRRGPLQAAFTDKELKELSQLDDVYVKIEKDDLILSPEEEIWLQTAPKVVKQNYTLLQECSERNYQGQSKILNIMFFLSPIEFAGEETVKEIKLMVNELEGDLDHRKVKPTNKILSLPVDLAFKSVGYKGRILGDIPFNQEKGIINNLQGKIIDENSKYQGYYTSGWIKRGPSGVIGTNKNDSLETVNTLLEDLPNLPTPKLSPDDFIQYLISKGIQLIRFTDWQKLNKEELLRGNNQRPRVKFSNNDEALDFLTNNKE